MQLVLERRAERSNTIALVSPLIAIGMTIVTMSILFAILGKNPISARGSTSSIRSPTAIRCRKSRSRRRLWS